MIEANDLFALIADYTQVGFMQAVKAYEPPQDRIRQTEAKRWLKLNLMDEKTFKKLCYAEKIKPFRIGTGRNSPLYYSKKEIMQAMATAKVSRLLLKQRI